jgi:hypothetical protein
LYHSQVRGGSELLHHQILQHHKHLDYKWLKASKRTSKINTTDEVYWQLKTSRNLVTTKTEDTYFLHIQPVQNNYVLLMQSSSALINLMTFNMASKFNLEITITGTNHSSLEQ